MNDQSHAQSQTSTSTTTGVLALSDLVAAFADKTVGADPMPSAQAWFAGGGRGGCDTKARAIVAVQDAPLKIFLRRQGDIEHAISFLPGYPDGSFGWAKVL